jgi:uncharacterized membrane protein
MKKARARLWTKLYVEFSLSGIVYAGIEAVYRAALGHKQTHPLVIFLGGIAFLIGVGVCRIRFPKPFFWLRPILGGALITLWELLFGLFFNVFLGYDIWSYRSSRYNFLGQVCLEFALLWIGMMILIEIIDFLFENIILNNSPYSFAKLGKNFRRG